MGTRRLLVGNAMAKQRKNKRIAEKKIGYREKLSGMDTVEGTLIVRTVVKWFSVLVKG